MFDITCVQIGPATFHGLVTPGDRETPIAIHLHGTGGNFYGNQIATELASIYIKHGFRFATVNMPGHDAEYETEVFADYAPALTEWISTLAGGSFILQGHSLGALKILDYMARPGASSKCKGAVLLSPFDILAFYSGRRPESVKSLSDRAIALMANGGSQTRISTDMFDVWPISARTYLEMIEEGGPADRFPSRDPSKLKTGSWLPTIPTILFIGDDDFAAYPSPLEAFSSLPDASGRLTAHLIKGAPHNFASQINAVGVKLDEWLAHSEI